MTTQTLLNTALAGLVAGALMACGPADVSSSTNASAGQAAAAKTNSCKGAGGCGGAATDQAAASTDKNSCKGADGCQGKTAEDHAATAPVDQEAKKKDSNSCKGANGCKS
jgi:hypothetical protein